MSIFLVATVFVALGYLVIQLIFILAWNQLKTADQAHDEIPFVSVVVAMRNELENIETAIASILAQDYEPDHFELILVDNHSVDGTLAAALRYSTFDPRITVLSMATRGYRETLSFKKEALTLGIGAARGSIIMTTDADCQVLPGWVRLMVKELQFEDKDLVTGPVAIRHAKTLIEQYQKFDLAGLMVATGGGIQTRLLLMGNGANLAFKKSRFREVRGYENMPRLSSGDDVFLLQELDKQRPYSIGFVKDNGVVVSTRACPTIRTLLDQRKRWSSKATLYKHQPSRGVALLVFGNSLFLFINLMLAILHGGMFYITFLSHFLIKLLADTWLIQKGMKFLGLNTAILSLIFAHFFNPILTILVPCMTVFSRSYQWKDRKTR